MAKQTQADELALQRATLGVIAAELGMPAAALRIEAKLEGRAAVFYDQGGAILCACALDSNYWKQVQARALAAAAIDQAGKSFSR